MASEATGQAPVGLALAEHGASTETPAASRAANPFRHWLATLNVAVTVFLLGAFAAPVLAASGLQPAADWLYAAYRFACHEWAFRSFFLFGASGWPINVYDQAQLASSTPDTYGFIGSPDLGWKMAFCERDLAIYVGLLIVGVAYARRRNLQPAGYGTYTILILPIAIDGFTQLFGWRESTWQLRVATGLLFGLASAWLVLPRLDEAFGLQQGASRDAPEGQHLGRAEVAAATLPGHQRLGTQLPATTVPANVVPATSEACDSPRPLAEPWTRLFPRG
jgi:uncharacterized membrane protein